MFRFVVLASFLVLAHGASLRPIFGIGQAPIVGGEQASITDAPWQVALQYASSGTNYNLRCGGSIISPTVILTAGHCTTGTSATRWQVRAGSSNHASGGTVHAASKVVTHESYSSSKIDYDMAVIILATPITVDGTNTKLIPLPAQGEDVAAGADALVTGWGSTSSGGSVTPVLRKVVIPVVDQAACAAAYQGFNPITDRMICGGILAEGGKDACQGDSGGPFVVGGKIVGVTSWGNGCAKPGYPGVWARVPFFVTWIQGQM